MSCKDEHSADSSGGVAAQDVTNGGLLVLQELLRTKLFRLWLSLCHFCQFDKVIRDSLSADSLVTHSAFIEARTPHIGFRPFRAPGPRRITRPPIRRRTIAS
eukprot:500292-Rhodomonas_salina.2